MQKTFYQLLAVFCCLLLFTAPSSQAANYNISGGGNILQTTLTTCNSTPEDDVITIMDSLTYTVNSVGTTVGAANLKSAGGSITIQAAPGTTPVIRRAPQGTPNSNKMFSANGSSSQTNPQIIVFKGASATERLKLLDDTSTDQSGLSQFFITVNDATKFVKATFENVIFERPETGLGCRGGGILIQNMTADLVFKNCSFVGGNSRLSGGSNSEVIRHQGAGSVYAENCDFTVPTGNGRNSLFTCIPPAANTNTAANWTFINCSFEPSSTQLESTDASAASVIMRNVDVGDSSNYAPNNTVKFIDCRFRVDDGYIGDPTNPKTPVWGGTGSEYFFWKVAFRVKGASNFQFIRPKFTGRCGTNFFEGYADLNSSSPYYNKGPQILVEGTPLNKIDLSPLTSTEDGTYRFIYLSNAGSATLKYAKNSANNIKYLRLSSVWPDDYQTYVFYTGETPSPSDNKLRDNVSYTAIGCEFFNGTGAMFFKPGISIYTDPNFEWVYAADNKTISLYCENTIFQAGAESNPNGRRRLIDCGPFFTKYNTYTPWNRGADFPFSLSFKHCTFYGIPGSKTVDRYVQGLSTGDGDLVTDNLTAEYCIFDSQGSPTTNANSNLPLNGVKNIAYQSSGDDGFPSVPSGTIVANANVDSNGRLTASSTAALGAATGSALAMDFEGDSRLYPTGSTPDIGADERVSYATVANIAEARASSNEAFISFNGIITDSFAYGSENLVYVEESDRFAGIQCSLPYLPGLPIGKTVNVKGVILTRGYDSNSVRGEKYILAADIVPTADPLNPLAALFANDRAVVGPISGIGTEMEGLLVGITGKVTFVDSVNRIFWVDDGSAFDEGSGLLDGNGEPVLGVRVISYNPSAQLPNSGDYVIVKGNAGRAVVSKAGGGTVTVPIVWQRD